MYLKKIWLHNGWNNGAYDLDFQDGDKRIKQWSIIEGLEPARALLLFKMLALCLGGKCENYPALAGEILGQRCRQDSPIRFGVELLTVPNKKVNGNRTIIISQEVSEVADEVNTRPFTSPFNDLKPLGYFAYGYDSNRDLGDRVQPEYPANSRPRHTRFETFLGGHFPLLPLKHWLSLQYRNADRHNSTLAQNLYNSSLSLISGLLPRLRFSHPGEDHTLSRLPGDYIAPMEFLVDFTRQISDSKVNGAGFNTSAGILFIHQVEKLFPLKDNPEAIRVLADIFPNLQFIFTCQQQEMAASIKQMNGMTVPGPSSTHPVKMTQWVVTKAGREKSICAYRNNFKMNRFAELSPAAGDTVVLIDVDSTIPNLALMKISRFYKKQGREVILTRESALHRKADRVFASCVFRNRSTQVKIDRLKSIHAEALDIGGAGVDIFKKLPGEIDALMPDYELYPGMDFAMGFLTRGCHHNCGFCLVPRKEGALRQVATLDDIVPPGFAKLVLLDNNLLAYPGTTDIFKEIIKRNLRVNFNQTLDIRYVTPGNAGLLVKIDSRNYSFSKRMYYFSLNSSALIPVVEEKINLLKGIKRHDFIFICMYGYDTTLSDDIGRFSFLQNLGVSPFTQRFQPLDGSPVPLVENYFDTEIDALLNISFYNNGRNFEGFLKWVSRRYVEEFGKLHMPLVDLIFKYNYKPYKYKYIKTMAGTLPA
ncbi:MAG: radical SAM protein [Candidatus Aminicenantes bacterium]|nr:radical SAM protein [Candidatus Aminicenantes bacterium]